MTTAVQDITEAPVTREDFVLGVVLLSGFRMSGDGWLYPQGQKPLVRIQVRSGQYAMERRRTPDSVWMQIVTASVHEFDQPAFEAWVDSWPLTA